MSRSLRIVVGVAVVLLCLPLVAVLAAPFLIAAPQWDYVGGDFLWQHVYGTLLLLAGTVLIALLLGVCSAWCVAALDFPGRKFFSWVFVLPLALPTYISALAFAGVFGPTGSFSIALHDLVGVRTDIMSLPGLCLVLALVLFPYVYLPARAAFGAGLTDVMEASRVLGASPVRRFLEVALPLARPAIVGGALLVGMETLNEFGAVKYFGLDTITTGIFQSWGGLRDKGSALRLAAVLLILVATLLATERVLRRKGLRSTDHRTMKRMVLRGAARWWTLVACALLFFFSSALPLAVLLRDALATADADHLAGIVSATGNTLYVGAWAAAITLVIALVIAWSERSMRGPSIRLSWFAQLGYVVPGAVIAVGVMAMAGGLDKQLAAWGVDVQLVLIGSLPLLVYAFAVRFLAVAAQPINAGLAQQPVRLDEAARTLGASPGRTFLRLNLPMLRPAMIAAVLLTVLEVMKELPLTLIMRPFDFETLSTKVHGFTRIEEVRSAALPALVIVLCALVPVLVLDRLQAGKNR
ncbi:MAG: iron ABC transporter permease [Flavobacteriales bacterium]